MFQVGPKFIRNLCRPVCMYRYEVPKSHACKYLILWFVKCHLVAEVLDDK